jgi:hypothetical protein
MTEQEWLACEDPERMLKYLRRSKRYRISDRKLRYFLVGCCRRVWQYTTDERSRHAVEIAERFADGLVGQKARGSARSAASTAFHELEGAGAGHVATAAAFAAWCCVEKNAWKKASGNAAAATVGHTYYADRPYPSIEVWSREWGKAVAPEKRAQASLLRCIVGNPFRQVFVDPSGRTPTVMSLAQAADEERSLPKGLLDPARLAILADALEETGCTNEAVLSHLREPGEHVRGCWVVDQLLL